MKNTIIGWTYLEQCQNLIMENNPDLYIQFVCFLYECNDTPKNKEEKYSKKLLQKFIDTNLEFVDDDIYCDKMLQELMEQKGKK